MRVLLKTGLLPGRLACLPLLLHSFQRAWLEPSQVFFHLLGFLIIAAFFRNVGFLFLLFIFIFFYFLAADDRVLHEFQHSFVKPRPASFWLREQLSHGFYDFLFIRIASFRDLVEPVLASALPGSCGKAESLFATALVLPNIGAVRETWLLRVPGTALDLTGHKLLPTERTIKLRKQRINIPKYRLPLPLPLFPQMHQ